MRPAALYILSRLSSESVFFATFHQRKALLESKNGKFHQPFHINSIKFIFTNCEGVSSNTILKKVHWIFARDERICLQKIVNFFIVYLQKRAINRQSLRRMLFRVELLKNLIYHARNHANVLLVILNVMNKRLLRSSSLLPDKVLPIRAKDSVCFAYYNAFVHVIQWKLPEPVCP